MSLADQAFARAGRLSCFCPAAAPVAGEWRGLMSLAGGFAASVLSQSLVLGLAPLAGLLLAPKPVFAVAPLIAMLLGAAVATFPASFLLDTFGRRVSFALGASHGIAGALLMAWSLSAQAFAPLLLGAFWVGVAQGFSLFYRHEAAMGVTAAQRFLAIGFVFGAGSLAGIAGPAIANFAAGFSSSLYVGAALAAGAAQFVALCLAAFSSRRLPSFPPLEASLTRNWRAMFAPTLVGALAWFSMSLLMLAAPFAMIGCGIGSAGIMGAVAWHVVAMYAPSLLLGPLASRISARKIAGAGLALIVVALAIFMASGEQAGFTAALVTLAIGWSFATSAATIWLHEEAAPDRTMLGLHDCILFVAAIAGAFAAWPFAGG